MSELTIANALTRAEERLRSVANPETGECPLDDTICPYNNNSKFREAIVREVIISFFKHHPQIIKQVFAEIQEGGK